EALGRMLNVAPRVARELEWLNDETYAPAGTDGLERWKALRAWVEENTIKPNAAAPAGGGAGSSAGWGRRGGRGRSSGRFGAVAARLEPRSRFSCASTSGSTEVAVLAIDEGALRLALERIYDQGLRDEPLRRAERDLGIAGADWRRHAVDR